VLVNPAGRTTRTMVDFGEVTAQAAANPNFGVRVKKVTFGSAE
jgi:hypothetical protein